MKSSYEVSIRLIAKADRALQGKNTTDHHLLWTQTQKVITNINKSNPAIYRKHNMSQSSGVYPRNIRLLQHSKFNYCNSPYWLNNNKNMIILILADKAFNKKQYIFIHDTFSYINNNNSLQANSFNLIKALPKTNSYLDTY